MKKCYLLVRKFDNAIVETCEKVYTSYEFAMKMLEQAKESKDHQELKDNLIELSKPRWEKVFR